MAGDLNPVIPPNPPKLLDYPAITAISGAVFFTAILLFVINRYDATGGTLTVSLLVVLAFLAVISVSLFFTIPNDEITSAVIGGLIASFASVITYWLARSRNGKS